MNTINTIHIWEKKEIILKSNIQYKNPYVDVEVWVDLVGPEFSKRVYGYWDGKCIQNSYYSNSTRKMDI